MNQKRGGGGQNDALGKRCVIRVRTGVGIVKTKAYSSQWWGTATLILYNSSAPRVRSWAAPACNTIDKYERARFLSDLNRKNSHPRMLDSGSGKKEQSSESATP